MAGGEEGDEGEGLRKEAGAAGGREPPKAPSA
jgi:hypothetical protein